MTPEDLEARYRRYLASLNARELEQLDHHVHQTLRDNGEPLTRDAYRDMIAGDVAAIPDLFFAVDLLVVQGDHVAGRLRFDCSPRKEFRGLHPDGRRVSFAEHVFYRYREGRISEVWSLIDTDALRRQLDTGE